VLRDLFGLGNTPPRRDDQGWDLIFTSGATASLKLVGAYFPWNGPSTCYRYLKESHTSLVGIRNCALAKGASVESVCLSDIDFRKQDGPTQTLWGYSAQCNVTRSRLCLELAIKLKRQNANMAVLVDAASYLSTPTFQLDSMPYDEAPDFLTCAFYKICVRPSHPPTRTHSLTKTTSSRDFQRV
jgi:molybdenum cofactor sulfurtransferase